MTKAVLFDLFETLITESRTQPTRASSLGRALGLDQAAFRVEWRARRPRIVLGQLSFADALTEISQTLAGTANTAVVQRICEQRVREKTALFARIDEQVASLVSDLSTRGIRLGIISNCFEEDIRAWPSCSLAREFQCAVFSFGEGVAKPDPEIYLRGARRLGVDPTSALFIGDGGDNELVGAEQAGLRAFRAAWFTRDRPSAATGPGLPHCQNVLDLMAASV